MEDNSQLRRIRRGALIVIMAGVVMPMGLFSYDIYEEKLTKLTYVSSIMGEPAARSENDTETEPKGKPDHYVHGIADIDMAPEEVEPEITAGEIPSPLPVEDVSGEVPYPKDLTDHDGSIMKYTYGHYNDDAYFDLDEGGQVRNCTELNNSDLYEASKSGLPFELDKSSGEPQVLIYHTHATESFELSDKEWYDKDFNGKTTERDKNIISVGDAICDELDKAGICCIHDTLVHDLPDYNSAYQSSREAVIAILEEYPSIKICLDIHRDGIEREDGTRIAPVADIYGRQAAQIMIISCADDGSGDLPGYMDNFAFACTLQSALESDWPGLTRPILFDTRFYNQDLSAGSLLIEVGSHGNSLSQAQYSGRLIGRTLAELFE